MIGFVQNNKITQKKKKNIKVHLVYTKKPHPTRREVGASSTIPALAAKHTPLLGPSPSKGQRTLTFE
jgi:hypothetical protein